MGTLYRLDRHRRSAQFSRPTTTFNRTELNLLLSLYSRRVMSGEWRDYAIDQRAGMAVFSIYRHSQDRPLFTIAKRSNDSDRKGEYLICRGAEKLAHGASLAEALDFFQERIRVVS